MIDSRSEGIYSIRWDIYGLLLGNCSEDGWEEMQTPAFRSKDCQAVNIVLAS